jgi:hypothetical protein
MNVLCQVATQEDNCVHVAFLALPIQLLKKSENNQGP